MANDITVIEGENFGSYKIMSRGAMKYIVNDKGNVVSDGYHEFKVYKVGEGFMLLGKTGAMSSILKMPENEDGFFTQSEAEFHDIEFRKDLGYFTVSTGAMTYLLNSETGKICSKGYHEITKSLLGGLTGQTGSIKEPVQFLLGENGAPKAPLIIGEKNRQGKGNLIERFKSTFLK